MKISFLSTFFPFRGGIAQFNAMIYREFEKKNEVKAFTFKRQYPEFLFPGQTQFVTENDAADQIPAERVLDTINPFTYFSAARKMKASKPDLILTKYWMTFFAPSLGFVLGRMHKKAIRISILDNVIPHEKRFFDAAANRYFLKRNDGFVVMSDKVLKDLLSIRPDAKYIRVDHPIYNHFGAVLPKKAAQERLKLDSTKKTMLYFGIIRDYKGLDLLINVFSKLDDSYQLIIAGEVYGSFDKYQNLIDSSPNKERIHCFNHYISDAEVPVFFSAADVCMLTYKTATQSGITGITQHFELPVIATDVGGLKETVLHEKTGLIVDEVNEELIQKSVERYFAEELAAKFIPAIQEQKAANSWENFVLKLEAFYGELKVVKK